MSNKPITPKCPQCKCKTVVQKIGDDMFRCGSCGGLFDNDPDEGGDYGWKPEQRALRQERQQLRKRRRKY